MQNPTKVYLDNAATTQCCNAAVDLIKQFADTDFGNPSSNHLYGQKAALAIRDARGFFAEAFQVSPRQVIFTGSGSEADNLAIYGVSMAAWIRSRNEKSPSPIQVLFSATEHPAVRKTAQSLTSFGIDVQPIPVDSQGQIQTDRLLELLTPSTVLVSIHLVNNIIGTILPVEELAHMAKKKAPGILFHTDAVQAFGKVPCPQAPSSVDLISISGHKVEGPKGVGALILLNERLLESGLRPLIWGGEQEQGLRSGTQNAGLIAGFHVAAKWVLHSMSERVEHVKKLRDYLKQILVQKGMLSTPDRKDGVLTWNSPDLATPHIINMSMPGYPTSALTKLLEEKGCFISTGSACSSQKTEPDIVLSALGLSPKFQNSALRVSLSSSNTQDEIEYFASALEEAVKRMTQLLGPARPY